MSITHPTLERNKVNLTFRKWSNKSYAVFNSLNKIIKIAFLNVVYSLLSIATSTAFAQEDSLRVDKKLELDEIEIVSVVEPLAFSQQARIVNLITKKEILQSPHSDFASLLKYQKGIDIRQRGGFGVQSDLTIRGSSFDQVLILLNGFPLSDPQTGHFSLNIPFDAEIIKRVELIQGSVARIFGENAFAGAVNIITQPANRNHFTMLAEGGENGHFKLGSSANFLIGNTRTFFSYSKAGSDGYQLNTDYKLQNLFLQTLYNQNKYSIDFQFGVQKKEFGANGFYSVKYPLQFEYNNSYNSNLSVNFGKTFVSKIGIYGRIHQDQWILTRENPILYQNFHQTASYGIKTNHRYTSNLGKTQIGSEIKYESIWSSSLGESSTTSKPVPWNPDYDFTHFKNRKSANVFIDQQYLFKNGLFLSSGLLFHLQPENSKTLNMYPGIDLSYSLFKNFQVIASLNKAMRQPTFTDLYYSGPANIGNPNLKAETATSFETGIKYSNLFLNAEAVYFNRNGKEIIDWVWDANTEKWQTQNILNQTLSGFEVGAQFRPRTGGRITNISVNYTYLNANSKDIPELTKYHSTHLKHQLNMNGHFVLSKGFYASISFSYRDRVGSFQLYDFEQMEYDEKAYSDQFLFDFRMQYKRAKYTIYLDGINVLNSSYYEYGILQPGRWLKTGILITFGADDETAN